MKRGVRMVVCLVPFCAALACTFYLLVINDVPAAVAPLNTTSVAHALQSQINLYWLQHTLPPDFAAYPQAEQLLAKTTSDGAITSKGTLGPYLNNGFPYITNPCNQLQTLCIVTKPISHGVTIAPKPVGWVYSVPSHLLYATDAAGTTCINPTMLTPAEPVPALRWSSFEHGNPVFTKMARTLLMPLGLLPPSPGQLWIFPGILAAFLALPLTWTIVHRSPRFAMEGAHDAASMSPPPTARYDTRHIRRRVHLDA